MSKLGKELIKAAREGVAIARGELAAATYRVHKPDDARAGFMSGPPKKVSFGRVGMGWGPMLKPAEPGARRAMKGTKKKSAASPKRRKK